MTLDQYLLLPEDIGPTETDESTLDTIAEAEPPAFFDDNLSGMASEYEKLLRDLPENPTQDSDMATAVRKLLHKMREAAA